jgi:hypothetical protein
MARMTPRMTLRPRSWRAPLVATFLPVVLLVGCANTCFIAISSPPNGTIAIAASSAPSSCAAFKTKGTIRIVAHASRLCEFCSESNQIRSVYVAFRSVELHPKAEAGKKSPEWLELLPQLENQSRQVDLMKTTPNSLAGESVGEEAEIPAGFYDWVRLRFVPNQGDKQNQLSQENPCGSVGVNCAIMMDGRVQPLFFDDVPELRISLEPLPGGALFIPPDSGGELIVELTPLLSMIASFPEGARFLPVLAGSAKFERNPAVEEP